jgi:tetratricopeptide (TPR) repeat protein
MRETDIKQIAAKVKQLKRNGFFTILFLGAGASKTAGIPLADEIMNDIDLNVDYKELIDCQKRTYPNYMNCLSSNDRKKLFQSYISKANINTAHYYAAQLMAEGYVDCVVTTNFDSLMLRSLTQFYSIIPYIYDLAITTEPVTADFEYPAILYLHGQAHGFWQLNTAHELKLPEKVISDAFSKISKNRAWIIVGYSGNDPVLDHLVKVGNFCENLYWVGYEMNDPSVKVMEELLSNPANGAQLLRNYNADSFFLELRNQLKIGEPPIFSKPFTYMLNKLDTILPIVKDDKTLDLFAETKKQIQFAINGFELKQGFEGLEELTQEKISREDLLQKIKEIYNNNNFDELKAIQTKLENSKDEEILKYYSYALNSCGIKFTELARIKEGEEADRLSNESFEKYNRAVEIKKDLHEAFYNWGTALYDLAMKKEGEEADKLFNESFEKFNRAVEIKKDKHEAFNNWGLALSDLANKKEGTEADKLFNESFEKFNRAVEIKKDKHEAFYNWGNALSDLAKTKEGEEADKLFNESFDKYQRATEIKKDLHEAFYNWGTALSNLAKNKEGEEADKLFNESFEKYQRAAEIKKDYHEAFNNWGIALKTLALKKEGEESDRLFYESFEKYNRAVEIKKDYHEAFNNWGIALSDLAKKKEGEDSKKLLQEAIIKCLRVEELKEGKGAYNLACIYSLLKEFEISFEWFEKALKLGKTSRDHIEKDTDLDNIRTDHRYKELLDKYR